MKRTTSVVAALLAATLSVAACSSGGSDGDGDGSVKLVFRQFDPESETAGLKTAIDAWNQNHPDIQVELQTLSPNNIQQFAREANSGSGPDINQVAFADVAFVANPKILKPLDEYLGSGGKDDLLATDMVTFDDKTWAVPWTADTMALVYNKEKLGSNKPPTTWEELATTAASIKNGFCFPAAGSATSAQWFAINYYLWSHDAAFIKKDAAGAWSAGATKEQLTSAIDYFNGLFTSGATGKAFQAVQDYSDPAIVNGLANGDCAMSYMPPATFAKLTEQAGDKVTSAPMPDGLKDGATHLGGRGLAINRNSKHPDHAYAFIKYLTSAETFKTYKQYPASKKTLTELQVPDAQKGYVEQLPHSQSMARYIGSDLTVASIQQLVNQQFSAVYSGQASSADAAQAILDGLAKGLKG